MFNKGNNDIDIGKNIKMVDFLKCELLNSTALLFETLVKGVKGSKESLLEVLANIILVTYTLGRRLGIEYDTIDRKVQEKSKIHILEEHHLEKWYGDLSSLNRHLNKHRK